ncbi:Crp/Fnr family transcriptional regulator [Fibrella aquatilis]|uniref:Cyclic nucleotide-binding domain-containing protein n=1 Tax=Fibrella aquatilis TaxID=2817059 RepID=A0A939K164_9BACT|nr:cyclic nucleotide-binding domain-containing protein [Fibrella aquatilis]MBO0931945.1 cyclic nucleotide-binding domain-containing protein [Fibrella aquatilis]
MQSWQKFIERYASLTPTEWADVQARSHRREVARNELYLQPGQVNKEFVFIDQGGLRVFQITADGEEHTAWLAVEGQSFCDLSSFRQQIPTQLSVQALADTSLITLSYADMQHLYQTLPVWQEFGRKLWEEVSVNLIGMILSFQAESAGVRYERISQNYTLLQTAPLKFVAEFLGITPHTLSRLRRYASRRQSKRQKL